MSLSISGSSGFLQAQQAMFARLDLNTDGSLSADEFSALGQNLPSEGGARQLTGGCGSQGFSAETLSALMGVQQTSKADRAAEMFANADADGDGSVTAEELSTDLAAHAPPGVEGADSATMAADMIAAGDTDGDGSLSSEEFSAMKPSGPPLGGPPPGGAPSGASETASEDETTYDAADTNKDGTVSMSELLASLQSSSNLATGFSGEVSDLMAQLLEKLTSATSSTTQSVTA